MTTLDLDTLILKRGAHMSPADGACFLEAASYIAGESWSDHPACVSPVIAQFGRSWNDALQSDEKRTRLLRPLIPVILNTASTPAVEERRAWMALDWLIRVNVPAWMTLAGLEDELSALPEIADHASLNAAMPALESARKRGAAAWDAAWDAALSDAWAAARDAAWDAASDAARDAAWDAARDAASDAARDAASDAVWAAAWAAAWDALTPTVERLQESACDLIRRMAAVSDATL